MEEKLTPLEKARYKQAHPPKAREDCKTCLNCVEVGGAYYCEKSGKLLIPRFMEIARCMHVPSQYEKKEKK